MYKAPSSPRQRPLSGGSTSTDEGSQPPAKRLRLSEEDDEDEDQPLAITARMNLPSSSRFERHECDVNRSDSTHVHCTSIG